MAGTAQTRGQAQLWRAGGALPAERGRGHRDIDANYWVDSLEVLGRLFSAALGGEP